MVAVSDLKRICSVPLLAPLRQTPRKTAVLVVRLFGSVPPLSFPTSAVPFGVPADDPAADNTAPVKTGDDGPVHEIKKPFALSVVVRPNVQWIS